MHSLFKRRAQHEHFRHYARACARGRSLRRSRVSLFCAQIMLHLGMYVCSSSFCALACAVVPSEPFEPFKQSFGIRFKFSKHLERLSSSHQTGLQLGSNLARPFRAVSKPPRSPLEPVSDSPRTHLDRSSTLLRGHIQIRPTDARM